MAENVQIQGLIADLDRIKNMSEEEILEQQQNISQKNEKLQNQIEEMLQDVNEGELSGITRNRKAKDYKSIIKDIENLLGQIEANQQLIEVYVNERIARGDFKGLGIEDMSDFIKASQTSIDLSIEDEEEEIEQLEDTKQKVEENKVLQEVNDLITEKNVLLQEANEGRKELENIEKMIIESEKKIEEINEKLLNAPEDEKDNIAKELEEEKVNCNGLTKEKDVLLERNKNIKIRIKEINTELKEKGIEQTNILNLKKVYKQNEGKMLENNENIIESAIRKGLPIYDNQVYVEDIQEQIDKRISNIENLSQRKEEIRKTQESVKQQEEHQQYGDGIRQQSGEYGGGQNYNQNNSSHSYNVLPTQYNGNIFSRMYNRFKNRFSPQQKMKREEFIRQEHPDWDDITIEEVANSKERRNELNQLIQNGISPEVYAQSVRSDSAKLSEISMRKDNVTQRGSIVNEQAKSFDELLKSEAELTPEEKQRREAIKQRVDKSKETFEEKKEDAEEKE